MGENYIPKECSPVILIIIFYKGSTKPANDMS